MIYPRFVWMSYGWYTEGWWEDELENVDCTPEQMRMAIYRSLSFHHFPIPNEKALTDVKYVRKQLLIIL